MKIKFLLQVGCISALTMSFEFALAQDTTTLETGTPGVTGKYLGKHTLTMNSIDKRALAALALPRTTLNNVEYIVLGKSIAESLWLWDFDNHTITWGANNLLAMEIVKAPYQTYNPSTIASKTGALETYPEITDSSEVTIHFTDNGDGTYTADYALKIHLNIQGYPIAATSTTFRVMQRQHNKLNIITIDNEATEAALDGVPGTQIEGIFPYIVQPQFDSTEMYMIDGIDSNEDGITDLAARLLNLDPQRLDSDGDGLNDLRELGVFVRPLDTDRDGIADIYEPADTSTRSYIVAGLKLISDDIIALESLDRITFSFAVVRAPNLQLAVGQELNGDPLPKFSVDNKALIYSVINFTVDTIGLEKDTLPYTLTFTKGIPAGLQLRQKLVKTEFNTQTNKPVQKISYPLVSWQQNAADENAVDIIIPHGMVDSRDKYLIIGRTQKLEPEPTPTPISGSNGGGGSFDWALVMVLSGFALHRRRLVNR